MSNNGVLHQYMAATSAAMSLFIIGSWISWASPAVKMITSGQTHIEISVEEISWIVSLLDIGNVLSPIPSSYMSDYFGRKNTLISTAFLFLATWLLAIFGPTVSYLYVARIGAGIGKGIAFTTVPMFLGEIAGVNVRGAISTIFTGLLYSGSIMVYCIGPFVSYQTLNTVLGVVSIIFLVTIVWMPESPYFYLMKNRQKEASASLSWYRAANNDKAFKDELENMKTTVQKEMEQRGSFTDLVSNAGNRKALLIIVYLSCFQRLGGITTLLTYTVVTLPPTGGWFKPDIYMFIFSLTLLLGNCIATPLIDNLGRKPLLLISCTGCAVMTAISGTFYWLSANCDISSYNWIPYACLVSYAITYSLGIGVIPSTFVGELFPTNVKSYASSIGAIAFAVGSFLINKIYLGVKESWGVHYMFAFFTLCSISSVLFTTFVVIETKGKTFSEIQNKLNNTKIESIKLAS